MAAEPLVQSPIAFAWGPDGKLWVVEMGDYPLGIDGKGKPGGRVKYLEDTDGDGNYDKATVFLDRLSFPTSVLPWRKGVLVTCAPDIFYAEDTNGDRQGGHEACRSTPASREGNPQHRVNGLVWGLDNWIYCANGDSGGVIKSVKTGKAIDIAAATSASGPTRRTRSRRPARRSTAAAATTGATGSATTTAIRCGTSSWTITTSAATRTWPRPTARAGVRHARRRRRSIPISRTLPRFNDPHAANHFTSACSAIVYRDDLFGPGLRRQHASSASRCTISSIARS